LRLVRRRADISWHSTWQFPSSSISASFSVSDASRFVKRSRPCTIASSRDSSGAICDRALGGGEGAGAEGGGGVAGEEAHEEDVDCEQASAAAVASVVTNPRATCAASAAAVDPLPWAAIARSACKPSLYCFNASMSSGVVATAKEPTATSCQPRCTPHSSAWVLGTT